MILSSAGIDVGYQFYSRAEMVALGLHTHCLNDVDYMGFSYKTMVCMYVYLLPHTSFLGRKTSS